MAFGYTFSFRGNEPTAHWLFVWVTFYLTVPAVPVSWLFPKLGAYWVLLDTGISISIVAAQRISWYWEFRRHPYPLAYSLPIAIAFQVFYVGSCFWAGKLIFGLVTLHLRRRAEQAPTEGNAAKEARELRPSASA